MGDDVPSLVVDKGLGDHSTIILNRPITVFGQSSSVDIHLDNRYVSRRHFQLRRQDGVYFITDLDSTNGTYLNDERLKPNEERRLRDQDSISLAQDQVVLRFSDPVKTARIATRPQHEELVVDVGAREIQIRGTRLTLPTKEFDILALLYSNRSNAVRRDEIGAVGWPERPDGDVTDEEIDQYISRLRRRIEENPAEPRLIVTIRGYGYRMA